MGVVGYAALSAMSAHPPPVARLYTFVAGEAGPWRVDHIEGVAGESLTAVPRLSIVAGPVAPPPAGVSWILRGITSNERYVVREEKLALAARQPSLGRAAATRAALIPIRKNAAWWSLAQDERREIFEAQSRHI